MTNLKVNFNMDKESRRLILDSQPRIEEIFLNFATLYIVQNNNKLTPEASNDLNLFLSINEVSNAINNINSGLPIANKLKEKNKKLINDLNVINSTLETLKISLSKTVDKFTFLDEENVKLINDKNKLQLQLTNEITDSTKKFDDIKINLHKLHDKIKNFTDINVNNILVESEINSLIDKSSKLKNKIVEVKQEIVKQVKVKPQNKKIVSCGEKYKTRDTKKYKIINFFDRRVLRETPKNTVIIVNKLNVNKNDDKIISAYLLESEELIEFISTDDLVDI